MENLAQEITFTANECGRIAKMMGVNLAVAESLTSGGIAQTLGAAPEAAVWFAGGIVAYQLETKVRLLGVDPGPVITALCAEQMAVGVRSRSGADFSVAVTGVGGPGHEERQAPGTVYIATSSASATISHRHLFHGTAAEVVALTTLHALKHLARVLEEVS